MSDITTLMMAASGAVGGEYEIERSLRFNSADSAYLSRTPASASNRKTWTFSGWVKRSKLGMSNAIVFGSGDTYVNFETDRLAVNLRPAGTNYFGISTAKFRDVSAWYHIVAAVDTTQATAANRLKMWVNNQLITAFDVSSYLDIPVNTDTAVNSTNAHNIGRYTGTGEHFDGYMTEINFIDGQALTPSSFGEFNATTGVWSPIRYAGTYGTNGFYLNFSDNTSTTTLGDDLSGNGNDWTTNNFSVTAGAGNDSLVDVPTRNTEDVDTGVGGEVRGNYCTLNPLATGGGVLFNGNLTITSAGHYTSIGTIAFPKGSGKIYFEATLTTSGAGGIGVTALTTPFSNSFPGAIANLWWFYDNTSNLNINNQTSSGSYASRISAGQVWQIAYDAATGKVFLGFNNTWINSTNGTDGDPANGSNPTFTISTSADLFPFVETAGNAQWDVNFGQRPFAYTAPSGFKALVTTNLPDPTIVEGDEYFNTVLYTGTGSSLGVTGVGFQPDWVWIKERNAAADHGLYDAVRGVQNQLESNTDTAETVESTGLTAFGTDGFTVGALAQLNTSADTYVAWNWKANGAGVSNTAGTISSTVSVSTTSGFSIVTYTGTGSAATVGHGLGAVPRMIIVKNRDQADAWQVYHAANTANPETDYLVLNTTATSEDAADRWNDTLPTSTVFSIGNGVEVNTNTEDYVAYCFAPVAGYSAFGSYTGNGSANGPFIFTGFRPAWVIAKRSDAVNSWNIIDATRSPINQANDNLAANSSNAENAAGALGFFDFLSNGFKVRTDGAHINASGGIWIYAAFAENPFKYSLGR